MQKKNQIGNHRLSLSFAFMQTACMEWKSRMYIRLQRNRTTALEEDQSHHNCSKSRRIIELTINKNRIWKRILVPNSQVIHDFSITEYRRYYGCGNDRSILFVHNNKDRRSSIESHQRATVCLFHGDDGIRIRLESSDTENVTSNYLRFPLREQLFGVWFVQEQMWDHGRTHGEPKHVKLTRPNTRVNAGGIV